MYLVRGAFRTSGAKGQGPTTCDCELQKLSKKRKKDHPRASMMILNSIVYLYYYGIVFTFFLSPHKIQCTHSLSFPGKVLLKSSAISSSFKLHKTTPSPTFTILTKLYSQDDNSNSNDSGDGEDENKNKRSVGRGGGRNRKKDASSSSSSSLSKWLKKNDREKNPLLSNIVVALAILFLIPRLLFGGIFGGSSSSNNVYYYSSSVYETRTYDAQSRQVITSRKEEVKSNMPGLVQSKEGRNSNSNVE